MELICGIKQYNNNNIKRANQNYNNNMQELTRQVTNSLCHKITRQNGTNRQL